MDDRGRWGWSSFSGDDKDTGPRSGAGCMILARRTGRFLFCLRPEDSRSGGTWSPWGGKAEHGERPEQTARREVREETGYDCQSIIHHLYHASTRTFHYDTFLMIVDDEFTPHPSGEWKDYAWLPLEEAPTPRHWGLQDLLEDRTAMKIMARAVMGESGRPCDPECFLERA